MHFEAQEPGVGNHMTVHSGNIIPYIIPMVQIIINYCCSILMYGRERERMRMIITINFILIKEAIR